MKIIKVKNPEEGIEVCKKLLYEIVSKKSVLFLSGGSTPKVLYQKLAEEKKLKAGAVALVDERFGEKLHENSNEKMIQDTGLIQNLSEQNTRFYPILRDKDIGETAKDYDETVRYLFNYFPKSVGILGVGVDGHTAGLPAGMTNDQYQMSNKTDLVTSFDDFPAAQKERITLTFLGLSKLDQIIVLVFGKDKKKALRLMFKSGSIAEIPSRTLSTKEISDKVTLITDQVIK
ncbi:MAG TPA: 6-phosphogluconolactonase [Patescibacteria group bacterium]|jgi:6-phosphogluconolactonase/glucosamine-6-phosphate isomerase/deaminase|nr:6-phosphogluconolactonase [Patescibacteria group bacterium]